MYWSSSSGRIELKITKAQATQGYHQGQCDNDIDALRTVPAIKCQLDKLQPDDVRKELSECGAWGDDELLDHDLNLSRLLWLACGDIFDN